MDNFTAIVGLIGGIIGIFSGVFVLGEKIQRAKVELYTADSIGFVLSSHGYVSKLHLRCNFVNKTSKLGAVHRLEIEVRSPDNKIFRFPWKLFYEYQSGADSVQKQTDPYPVAVMPRNSQTLFIEFESLNSIQSSELRPGHYELKVIGWVNKKNRSSDFNLESSFQIEISDDVYGILNQTYPGPKVYFVPVKEWSL